MQWVINFLYKFANASRWLVNRCFGKSTLGVRAIVINNQKNVLLVKHTYQPGWYLPGGGVKRNETFVEAISRELKEEAAIEPILQPRLFGLYHQMKWGISNYPALYIVESFQLLPGSFSREIKEIGWFNPDQLPPHTTPATKRRLKEYFENHPQSLSW